MLLVRGLPLGTLIVCKRLSVLCVWKCCILTAVNISNEYNGVSLLFSLLLFVYVKCDIVAIILFFWFYFQEDFDVDHFVSDCQKRVQLEALRDDLELYHKVLKTAMVELINKDYADFVNLSTNLVNSKSTVPTCQCIYTCTAHFFSHSYLFLTALSLFRNLLVIFLPRNLNGLLILINKGTKFSWYTCFMFSLIMFWMTS